jgi:hypothetical protein
MPSIEFTSNVAPKDVNAFLIAASAKFSEAIGKPEKLCLVSWVKNPQMIFAGSLEPCFIAQVKSIGNIDNDRNAALSATFAQFLEQELGIGKDRGYYFFHDIPGDNTGCAGTTYTNLIAGASKK